MGLQAIMNSREKDNAVLEYPQFPQKVREWKLERTIDSLIDLSPAVSIVDSATDLVESVFKRLDNNYDDVQWIPSRAILTPKNRRPKSLNNQVAEVFPGAFSYYKSGDSVVRDSLEAQNAAELRYPQELLNPIEVGASLPDHEIALKKGFIVMLLRNIKPSSGHVNGTRYVVDNLTYHLLFLSSYS